MAGYPLSNGMTDEALSIELPVRPESARKAREAVTEFRDQLDAPTHNDLRLVVSELVADVVRGEADGTHQIGLRIELRDRRIRASVIDGPLAFRMQSRRPALDEPGWGIHLTRALGRRWGSAHDAERGSVWVEMELPDNPFANQWEIFYQGLGRVWYKLGTSEGHTPGDALRSWVEREGRSVPPGAYGVRAPGEVPWRSFRVDQDCTICVATSSAEDGLGPPEHLG